MKTCRKCKKQVPNNMKICKYCGTDISKVKPKSKQSKNNKNSAVVKNKNNDIKVKKVKQEKIEKIEKQVLDETEILDLTDYEEELKDEDILEDFNILESKRKDANSETKVQIIYDNKKRLRNRKILNIVIVFAIVLLVLFLFIKGYEKLKDNGNVVYGDEKIEDVTFKPLDIVTFKHISFKVQDKIEKSQGTAYKKPKKDNTFIIVKLSISNNSNNKYYYSGQYFTLLTKDGEINRVISPVDAATALYSGELVVGATKDGSVVYEVPNDLKEAYLLYYHPEEMKKYEEKLSKYEEEKEKLTEDCKTIETIDEINPVKKPSPKFRIKLKID